MTPERQRREAPTEIERLIFFSDAVFAIALTLLALEVIPHVESLAGKPSVSWAVEEPQALWNLASYVGGFLVVGATWNVHRVLFRRFSMGDRSPEVDRWLAVLSMLLLFAIALLPALIGLGTLYRDIWTITFIYIGDVLVLLAALWGLRAYIRRVTGKPAPVDRGLFLVSAIAGLLSVVIAVATSIIPL